MGPLSLFFHFGLKGPPYKSRCVELTHPPLDPHVSSKVDMQLWWMIVRFDPFEEKWMGTLLFIRCACLFGTQHSF